MLRIRPTIHTPQASRWADLLITLGLREMTRLPATGSPAGTAKRCFAADAGRILLEQATGFNTELVFEVRDLERFVQWTIGDGTPVTLRPAPETIGSEPLAFIAATDGLVFTALAVDPSDAAGTPRNEASAAPGPEGQLSVMALWYTPDVPGAQATLANIGAKPDTISDSGNWAQYRAKHGGYVAAHSGTEASIELSLEYAGKLEVLAKTVSAAGITGHLVDEAYGRTLLVEHPDGGQLWINERQQDLYGYDRH